MYASTAASFHVLLKYKFYRVQSSVLRFFLSQKRGPVLTGYLVMCHPSALLLKRSLFPAVSDIHSGRCTCVYAYGENQHKRENIDGYIIYDDDDDSSPLITRRGIGIYYDYYDYYY